MEKQTEELELFDPSDMYEYFTKDFISKSELCELFNVSKAWIDKVFTEGSGKKTVYVTRIKLDKNGEKEEYRNRHVYFFKENIKRILGSFRWYRFKGTVDDYEAFKNTGRLVYFWEEINRVKEIKLENIHAGYRMPKGGMREKTAIKNGYLKIQKGRITLYYDNKDDRREI